MNDNKWLSAKMAAIELGYNENHVRRMLRAGRIKGQKLAGVVWRISRTEVERIKGLQIDGRYYPESGEQEEG